LKAKNLAEVASFASLYAVLVWLLQPISYAVLQFRVAEALKSIVVVRKHLILAFVIGNFLSNLTSPFIGPWELGWMPFINLLGGSSAWFVGHKLKGCKGMALGGFIFALWIAFGVGLMLSVLFNLPFWLVFIYILIPEVILIVGGAPLMFKINKIIEKMRV